MTAHVWCAAYGSNCDDDRFACYLRGGRPRGSTRDHVGCRDTTAPTATTTLDLPHAVYFGDWSPYWRGAVPGVRGRRRLTDPGSRARVAADRGILGRDHGARHARRPHATR